MYTSARKEKTYTYTRLDRWWVFGHYDVLQIHVIRKIAVSWVIFRCWHFYALKDIADSYVIHPVICSSVFSTTVDDRHAVHCGAREPVGMRWRQKKARPNARARGRDRVFFAGAHSQRALSGGPWRRAVMRKVCAHMDREHGAVKRKGHDAAVICCLWIRPHQSRITKAAPVGQLAAEGYLRSNGKLPWALAASTRR